MELKLPHAAKDNPANPLARTTGRNIDRSLDRDPDTVNIPPALFRPDPDTNMKPWMATPRHETRRLVVDAVSFILAVILVLAAVSVDYAP